MNFEIQGDIYFSAKVESKRKTGKEVMLVYWFTMNLFFIISLIIKDVKKSTLGWNRLTRKKEFLCNHFNVPTIIVYFSQYVRYINLIKHDKKGKTKRLLSVIKNHEW